MLTIAIVDDEEKSRSRIRHITEQSLGACGREAELALYGLAEELLIDLDQGRYFQLYLLDVEMPVKNGIALAREIRKRYLEPVIIYVTDYVEYSIEAFEVNAYRYIPKKFLQEKLPEAFASILPGLEEEKKECYIIRHYSDAVILDQKDIYFLEKEGKYVVFHHRNGTDRVRKSMKEVLEELSPEDFWETGKGYAVNIRHIMSFEKRNLVLRNGRLVPIGRYREAEIKEKLIRIWSKQ